MNLILSRKFSQQESGAIVYIANPRHPGKTALLAPLILLYEVETSQETFSLPAAQVQYHNKHIFWSPAS